MTRRILALVAILALTLAACTPRFQQGIEDAIRAFADGPGGAALVITDAGVVFTAGVMPRLDTVLFVGGENLIETDDACEPFRAGVVCFLEEGGRDLLAGELVEVAVTGEHMSANVSYYLPDHPIPFGFYVRERPPEPATE